MKNNLKFANGAMCGAWGLLSLLSIQLSNEMAFFAALLALIHGFIYFHTTETGNGPSNDNN